MSVGIICDGCDTVYPGLAREVHDRHKMERHGWRIHGSSHYCDECVTEMIVFLNTGPKDPWRSPRVT